MQHQNSPGEYSECSTTGREIKPLLVRFEILTAVVKKSSVFWDITLCLFAICFTLISCFAYYSTLKTEAKCSPETSVEFWRTTRRYSLEDRTLQSTTLLSGFMDKTNGAMNIVTWVMFWTQRWGEDRCLGYDTLIQRNTLGAGGTSRQGSQILMSSLRSRHLLGEITHIRAYLPEHKASPYATYKFCKAQKGKLVPVT
jgi:hypothetical protein